MIAAGEAITIGAQVVSGLAAIAGMFTMVHYTVRYVVDVSNNWRVEAGVERERRLAAEAALEECRAKLRGQT